MTLNAWVRDRRSHCSRQKQKPGLHLCRRPLPTLPSPAGVTYSAQGRRLSMQWTVTGEKHAARVIFHFGSKPVLGVRADITSPHRAANATPTGPPAGSGQSYKFLAQSRNVQATRAQHRLPLPTNTCMTEARSLNMMGKYRSFVFYFISFSKILCMTHRNDLTN